MAQIKQKTVNGTTIKLFKTGKGPATSYRIERNGTVVDKEANKETATDLFFKQIDMLQGRDTGPASSFQEIADELNPFT